MSKETGTQLQFDTEFSVNLQTTINLKAFALQHHLAGFTRSTSE